MRQHARCATALLATMLLAGTAMGQTRKGRVKIVNGKAIVPGPAFKATPLVDVQDLKFYACKLKSNGADCTVITGAIVPHMAPRRQYIVTVDIELFEVCVPTMSLQNKGTVRVELDRPPTERATRFQVLAPPWYGDHARGIETRATAAHYTLRVTLRRWSPPKPPPVVADP